MYYCTSVLHIMVHCTILLHMNRLLKLFSPGTVLVTDGITFLPLMFLYLTVLGYEILQRHLLWKFVSVLLCSNFQGVLLPFLTL